MPLVLFGVMQILSAKEYPMPIIVTPDSVYGLEWGNNDSNFMYIENKKLVIDESEKDVVIRIFNLYHEGNSHFTIASILNEEKVLGKDNWRDSTITNILANEVYKRYDNTKSGISLKSGNKVKKKGCCGGGNEKKMRNSVP